MELFVLLLILCCPARMSTHAFGYLASHQNLHDQIHLELTEETLHQAVALIDRFLSQTPVDLRVLQLLGVACLFIASKYEERFAPEVF